MTLETELTVIKKSKLCSSLETVPVSHSPFSAFWNFHKMHQDMEVTF